MKFKKYINKEKVKILIQILVFMLITIFIRTKSLAAEIDVSAYSSSGKVYWDSMCADSQYGGYKSSSNGSKANSHIESVKLNNIDVAWSDSKNKWGLAKGDGSGSALSAYYPNSSSNNMTNADLVITPEKGYRIKKIVISCTYYGPYMCETWNDGNAFDDNFELDTRGAFIIRNLNSKYFSHVPSIADTNNNYFILIELEPYNPEIYVEYDYGNIEEFMDIKNTSFETADGWLNSDINNNLGIGSVLTTSTQFKYAYDSQLTGDSAAQEAANWKHYTNIVSEKAKEEAAEAGYYFAGWNAGYYDNASITQNTADSYNKYTYNLSETHGNAEYEETEEVVLATNVRLIAQWEPIEVEVIKKVTGLDNTVYENQSRTYKFILQEKDASGNWNDYGENFSIEIEGNGTKSANISPISAGTYRVVEVEGNEDWQIEDNSKMYLSVSDKEEFTLSYNNTSAQTIVTNAYTKETPKVSVNVIKKWEDNNNSYNLRPTSVIVELLQNGVAIADAEVNAENGWQYTFGNLEIYDTANNEYIYSVREKDEVDGYFLKEINKTDNIFTITNTKYGTIKINKEDLVTGEKLAGAVFKLEIKNADSQWETVQEYTSDSNGIIVINNLTYATYKLTEIRAPDGYNLNLENAEVELEINEANASYELTVSNKAKNVLPATGGGRIQVILLIVAIILIILPNKFKKKLL
ncbi:MAG: Cna B-type domain-containing protein [Clostridia bacterium]|nr:Cna B-type domain-containing protein [Clostridia bacterium]